LLNLSFKPTKKLEVGANASIAFAGNLDNPYLFLDKNSTNEWIPNLHSAVYIGNLGKNATSNNIWHATQIEGGPVLWSVDRFINYYKPISAKRIL
jgi:hypothetical protein